MDQSQLFYEDEIDAVRACIQALGGAKTVGHRLYPDKSPDKAGEHLNNALNIGHAQKLSFSEGITIMKWAREVGCHVAMAHVADACNYHRPDPREPEDQMAELQREFIAATKVMQQISQRMGKIE